MGGQSHIFSFVLVFLGQCATPRGPAFSEWYFFLIICGRLLMYVGPQKGTGSKPSESRIIKCQNNYLENSWTDMMNNTMSIL